MTDFKIGDVVERINSPHAGMKVGDRDVIESFDANSDAIGLTKFKGPDGSYMHQPYNLILVEEEDELPPIPESVLYREDMSPVQTIATLKVQPSKFNGDILFELHAEVLATGQFAFAGMRLSPDDVLNLAHDLTRMALKLKREQDDEND